MMHYEYLVVPAPRRGLKAKGLKGAEARFAKALSDVMNAHAADGWEYQRTDTLPSDERDGLMMNKVTVFQNMMVFRRTAQPAADTPSEPMPLIEDLTDDAAVAEDTPAPADDTPAAEAPTEDAKPAP
ncbi:hypothetical protein AN189_03535 [Loktanella sp. 3ANDIMAR09]|uniref:DUF4177 domain-containing protein n=1 Tax=Loktanella sp. 3ANDIMAR09 TaxID=1225657 RepID=UPI0006F698AD|nr:DUF4177 domain-containing protein [Loktanella sp. 3ANDIMAR09]KQI69489.1 hypothetical protein AN189_03535 [Loktanella sp. 3ANDIMAR09]